jgi:hypothetical protein
LRTLEAFWGRYQAALEANDAESQARWTLHGVRFDTASALVDRALQPDGESGVNETLVWAVRHALDQAWQAWNVSDALLPQAQQFCRNVKIVVSGGFNQTRSLVLKRNMSLWMLTGWGLAYSRTRRSWAQIPISPWMWYG